MILNSLSRKGTRMLYYLTTLLLTCTHSVINGAAKAPEALAASAASDTKQGAAVQALAATTKASTSAGAAAQPAATIQDCPYKELTLKEEELYASFSFDDSEVLSRRPRLIKVYHTACGANHGAPNWEGPYIPYSDHLRPVQECIDCGHHFLSDRRAIWKLPRCFCFQPSDVGVDMGLIKPCCKIQEARIQKINAYLSEYIANRFCCSGSYIHASSGKEVGKTYDTKHTVAWPTSTNPKLFIAQVAGLKLNFERANEWYTSYWREKSGTFCDYHATILNSHGHKPLAPK